MAGKIFIVNFLNYNVKSFPIFRALSRHKIPYAVYFGGGLFSKKKKKWRYLRRLKKLKNESLLQLFIYYVNTLLKKTPSRIWGIAPATFILVRGANSITAKATSGPTTETVYTHAQDYDIYLRDKHRPVKKGNFVVFLDEYTPYHPDYVHFKMSPPVTADEYYSSLRRFFDFFERKFNMDVVIAAHPRATYSQKDPVFGDRTVRWGRTCDLVRRSQMVILHCSTAINFAVLYRKPMTFITTKQLEDTEYRLFIKDLAAYFDQKPININDRESFCEIGEFNIPAPKYDRFIFDFIKAGGPKSLPSWKILSNRIRELNQTPTPRS